MNKKVAIDIETRAVNNPAPHFEGLGIS